MASKTYNKFVFGTRDRKAVLPRGTTIEEAVGDAIHHAMAGVFGLEPGQHVVLMQRNPNGSANSNPIRLVIHRCVRFFYGGDLYAAEVWSPESGNAEGLVLTAMFTRGSKQDFVRVDGVARRKNTLATLAAELASAAAWTGKEGTLMAALENARAEAERTAGDGMLASERAMAATTRLHKVARGIPNHAARRAIETSEREMAAAGVRAAQAVGTQSGRVEREVAAFNHERNTATHPREPQALSSMLDVVLPTTLDEVRTVLGWGWAKCHEAWCKLNPGEPNRNRRNPLPDMQTDLIGAILTRQAAVANGDVKEESPDGDVHVIQREFLGWTGPCLILPVKES